MKMIIRLYNIGIVEFEKSGKNEHLFRKNLKCTLRKIPVDIKEIMIDFQHLEYLPPGDFDVLFVEKERLEKNGVKLKLANIPNNTVKGFLEFLEYNLFFEIEKLNSEKRVSKVVNVYLIMD